MTGLIYVCNYQHHWNTLIECWLSWHVLLTKQPVNVKALLQIYRVQGKKKHSQPRISSCRRSTCQCCSRGGGSRARRRQPRGTCSWPHQSLRESASCFLQQGWPRKEQCLEGGTSLGENHFRHISPNGLQTGVRMQWKATTKGAKSMKWRAYCIVVWVVGQSISKVFKSFLVFSKLRRK